MQYHVDATMPDGGDGAAARPFRTIGAAAAIMREGDVCTIAGGTYRETVRPAASGVVFQARHGDVVVVSGCDVVEAWTRATDGAWEATVALPLGAGNQVFADGRMMWEARWPKVPDNDPRQLLEFPKAIMADGTTPTEIVDPALPKIDYTGAAVWVGSEPRWFCWTARVLGSRPGALTVVDNSGAGPNHCCAPGGDYCVFGTRGLLTAPNEWTYADGTLAVRTPDGAPPGGRIEAKTRPWAFDLRGRRQVELRGLHLFAASIGFDAASEAIVMHGLRIFYVDHTNTATEQYASLARSGLYLAGRGHVLRHSEVAYSAGNGVALPGRDCTVLNNLIRDTNYMGTYAAGVNFAGGGSGHVVSHNTIVRSGRHPVYTTGLHDCLFQYNDVAYAGYLTADLGLTYGNGVEGGNSEVRYNWFHDNVCPDHCFGIYFDHGCKNLIIHHNCVWGVPEAGLMNNQYANYVLWYANTVAGGSHTFRSTWQAGQWKDLYGCCVAHNVGAGPVWWKGHGLHVGPNHTGCTTLRANRYPGPEVPPGFGACPADGPQWRAGHDFEHPPTTVDTTRSLPPYRNLLRHTAWLQGSFAAWETAGPHVRACHARHGQWDRHATAMMGGWSAELGPGVNAIGQRVTDLDTGVTYELMGMFRVDAGEAELAVRLADGRELTSRPITAATPGWHRRLLRFSLPPGQTAITVVARKTDSGPGPVYVDNLGLQRR